MSPRLEQAGATDWLRKQARKIDDHDTLAVDEQTASAVTVEAWLQRRDIKYAPPTAIPMALIDEKRSRNNQARRDPLVAESVERFAQSFRQGRPFPPIVVFPLATKVVIIDGNNRHEAAKRAKKEFIQGIIIDEKTPSEMIHLLTIEANASHGVTPPLDWRIEQAFYLVKLGHGDEMAAEAAGVSMTQLRNARAAREADERARALRISGFSDLSMTSKMYMNGIKLEPIFHVAATMVVKLGLTIEQVRDLCRKVKTGRSEAEQMAILAEQEQLFIAESAVRKAQSKRVSSPKMALVTGIGLLSKLDPNALVDQIRTVHDRDVVHERLQELVEKVLEIQVAMEALKDMEE